MAASITKREKISNLNVIKSLDTTNSLQEEIGEEGYVKCEK